MKALKIINTLLFIIFVIILMLFLVFVLPEYLACSKTIYEGEYGTTIWGDTVYCGGENKAFGEAFTQLFALTLTALLLVIVVLKLIYNKLKKIKTSNHVF